MDGHFWYLKRCDLFEHLTAEQAARLEKQAVLRTFKKHELVYSPSQPGQTVLILASGLIKIKDLTPEGKETILAFIEEGEVFGELALLDGEPRQDYAESAADSQVLLLPREDLLWLMSQRTDMNRREFSRLVAATLGGVVAGASLAAAEDKKEVKKKDPKKPLLLQEPNLCRGPNTCKSKGKGGKNDCAGMGECATAKAHTCKGDNDCAGLGGCGAHPGENKCKGMGGCEVPLKPAGWDKARKNFEAAMKKAGKKVGAAPKK